jgi:hypothetical protein
MNGFRVIVQMYPWPFILENSTCLMSIAIFLEPIVSIFYHDVMHDDM